MLSKFLRVNKCYDNVLLARRVSPKTVNVRCSMVPATQYDTPFPKRMRLGSLLTNNWEIIPLFAATAFGIAILFSSIIWAIKNKVDTVYTTHSRDNISRTMDLRHPTVHKLVLINQRYEPWPEMQDVLDKMKTAEKRALVRAQACSL